MADLVVVCTDGSEASITALRAGLRVVRPDATPVIVTAVELTDPMLLTGSGHAGPILSPAEYEATLDAERRRAAEVLTTTAAALDRPTARTVVLDGPAGAAICAFVERENAKAVVIGTRGHGGLKRALLGSVSDHVVRHAACPVVVARPDTD